LNSMWQVVEVAFCIVGELTTPVHL
jgi:hypothetical protein